MGCWKVGRLECRMVGMLDGWKVQGVLSFPLFPDTSTEPSAAGARRGVCNCIRTTIPLGPAGRRPARAYDYDDDLYIIGVVCLSVCVSQKSLFPYSRDFVVSHVYSYIPYSKNLVVSMFLDTFRIQEIWSFPCFLTHSIIIPYSKNLVVSMFLDTFRIQRIWSLFLFIDTFGIQGIWSFLLYPDTFHIQKCLETVKRQNPLK